MITSYKDFTTRRIMKEVDNYARYLYIPLGYRNSRLMKYLEMLGYKDDIDYNKEGFYRVSNILTEIEVNNE